MGVTACGSRLWAVRGLDSGCLVGELAPGAVSFAGDGAAVGADQMGQADRLAALFALGRVLHRGLLWLVGFSRRGR